MQPRIETLAEKKLIGQMLKMSFSDNKNYELWHNFMPHKNDIKNALNDYLYSVEIYPPGFYGNFNPIKEFEKWAAVEVSYFNSVPENMKTLKLPEGLYVVFIHKGPASKGPRTYQYIFNTWLPHSEYHLDNRPHFALMGEKYKNNDPASEEEIWIPIR